MVRLIVLQGSGTITFSKTAKIIFKKKKCRNEITNRFFSASVLRGKADDIETQTTARASFFIVFFWQLVVDPDCVSFQGDFQIKRPATIDRRNNGSRD